MEKKGEGERERALINTINVVDIQKSRMALIIMTNILCRWSGLYILIGFWYKPAVNLKE